MCSITKESTMICIAGFSGGGKSTMSKIMQTYLLDIHVINGDNFMFESIIKFPEEAEKIFGAPVDTDDGKAYLMKNASPTNVDSENKLIKLAGPYVEKMFTKVIAEIMETHIPRFLILEWGCSPMLSFWNKAQYRIKVEPTDWNLLFEAFEKRIQRDAKIAKAIAEVRRLASLEFIGNATNIDYIIKNNYDEKFELDIKTLCDELINKTTPISTLTN